MKIVTQSQTELARAIQKCHYELRRNASEQRKEQLHESWAARKKTTSL